MTHDQVTQGLKDIGAAWAVRSDKYCDANDPYEDRLLKKKTYHIHPDRSYPHQGDIKRFNSLNEIGDWIKSVKRHRPAK